MIGGIEETARETIDLIIKIKDLMLNYKHHLRANYKFYSQKLLNNLFKHLYTKIEFVVKDVGVSIPDRDFNVFKFGLRNLCFLYDFFKNIVFPNFTRITKIVVNRTIHANLLIVF